MQTSYRQVIAVLITWLFASLSSAEFSWVSTPEEMIVGQTYTISWTGAAAGVTVYVKGSELDSSWRSYVYGSGMLSVSYSLIFANAYRPWHRRHFHIDGELYTGWFVWSNRYQWQVLHISSMGRCTTRYSARFRPCLHSRTISHHRERQTSKRLSSKTPNEILHFQPASESRLGLLELMFYA